LPWRKAKPAGLSRSFSTRCTIKMASVYEFSP
jgi:hypothetical protein